MDFFKSVFSDEPERTSDVDDPETQTPQLDEDEDEDEDGGSSFVNSGGGWSFGGLMETLASKSESVIQSYKKELEEFSSELKKETQVIRQVASRAVNHLPASLEVAQDSLESVGQAIDDLGATVSGIITHGKDALLTTNLLHLDHPPPTPASHTARYSRFDSQILAIQTNLNTYVDHPDDLDEFDRWKSGFVLSQKDEEIDNLLANNPDMDDLYRELVPNTIDDPTFWTRYFYKVYKLKQVEEARANLVKRAIAADDQEDLTWDVDDEVEEESTASMLRGDGDGDGDASQDTQLQKKPSEAPLLETVKVQEEIHGVVSQSTTGDEVQAAALGELNSPLSEQKAVFDAKTDQTDSCKDSDVSIVSTQPSLPEEQDLSWDEIEDLSGIDEKKASVSSESPSKADLRKRLSLPDEDEDLSWDIEDDD